MIFVCMHNTYIIHCYEPGDAEAIKEHGIRRIISKGEMVLLFGGLYNRQGLVELDYQYEKIISSVQYNHGLMQYRGHIYELTMPCGHIEEDVVLPDDASIF